MDPETRAKAAAKAKQMAWMIGKPQTWRHYGWSAGDDHAANVVAGRAHERVRNLAKLGKPVDRGEWLMTPPMVNAYYDPSKNVMAFPAGILQAPFFAAHHNLPVNLGAIGMVIGHELTHGFDDEGSQFDAVGNFAQWWKSDTRKAFDERTACVARQYDAYEVQPGLRVNGKLTLGENIADIGGLKLAFAAYRALRSDQGPARTAEGYTEDQQFFLAHAQAWCSKARPERERLQVQTDPHSPARFRVNGPVANLPEFAAAWQCKPGAPLAPLERCAVW
jgi:putative endopeptidase